jgi:hypothetical protein
MSDIFKITNENGLELIVTNDEPQSYESIMGGMDTSPSWEGYLLEFEDEQKAHIELIRRAIEQLGWVGEMAEEKANDTYFVFSDGSAIGYTWRAWGDFMSAIVGKNEGYLAYYMQRRSSKG